MKRTFCDICGSEIPTDSLSGKPYKADIEIVYKGEAIEGSATDNKIKMEVCKECYRIIKDNIEMVITTSRQIYRAEQEEEK